MIKNIEKSLQSLEDIVEQLEKGELPLAESLSLFEKGMQITQKCHTALTEAEQKVSIITEQSTEQNKQ